MRFVVWGPSKSGKTTFIKAWIQHATKNGATHSQQQDDHILLFNRSNGSLSFSISELHERPENLASIVAGHSEEPKILVCLCKTDQSIEEISSYISALNQNVSSASSWSVLLVVVTPMEETGQQLTPKAQSRMEIETAILTWSTQMSACEGLFEFSIGPGPGESIGMSEFMEGVIELGEQTISSKSAATPVLSRASSSELESDVSTASSASSPRTPTSAPGTTEVWVPTSPRANWSAHPPSPRSENVSVSAVSQQSQSHGQVSSDTPAGTQKSWLGATPRDSGVNPPASSWSSGTRPNTARNPRAWLSHSPQSSNESPPTFAPLSMRVPSSSSSLTPGSSSHTTSSIHSGAQSTMLRDSRGTKGQTSPLSPNGSVSKIPQAKLTSSVSTSQLNSPIRAISHTLSGNLGLKKKTSAKLQAQNQMLQFQHELEEMPMKQFQKLPATVVATISITSQDSSARLSSPDASQWYTSVMRFRIQKMPNYTLCALYTNENVQLGVQVPTVTWKMKGYTRDPSEPVMKSLTSVSNNGYPISVFTDPSTAPGFFWIREGNGLNGNCILISALDSTSMANYIRSQWEGIVFGTMKPGAFMSIFMHLWAEHCTGGIPPEPKSAIDLACADKSASRYMLESLQLFETEASSIPPLIRALHWFPYLCDLTLHACGITDEFAVPILQSLTLNPQLKSLNLAENLLSGGSTSALHALLTRPSKRLIILDLSGNPFGHKAVTAILDALAQNASVKRFSMSGVPMASKGNLVALTQLLERNHALMSLKLTFAAQTGSNASTETVLAPIFDALLYNTNINHFDLGLPSDSPTNDNIHQIVSRNARGVSSLTLAGWLSDWPKLLDFVPTTTAHYQLILRANSSEGQKDKIKGAKWKNVASFTGTMEEGAIGTLSVSREGIRFEPLALVGSINQTPSIEFQFQWTTSLKIGQLTSSPTLIVVYDPSRAPDPLVVTMPTPTQVLEVVLCINALEDSGVRQQMGKPLTRHRAHAMGTAANPAIEYYLDFSKAALGTLLAPTGGSGTEVRLASLNNFDCCVKIMDCSQYGQDSVDSMEKEISLLIMSKGCNHIVQYLHHERQGHSLRLFMELFPSSLRKTIRHRAETKSYFTPQQVYILARHMLKALRFLHTQPQPIVHRDIKSDNFLVEEDLFGNFLRVKLTDFGSAKILTKGRTSSIDQGTSGYQAPEMVRAPANLTHSGNQNIASSLSSNHEIANSIGSDIAASTTSTLSYTTAVDIFAFGITLYEVLALERVYPNCQSRQEIEEALRNAEKFPPDFTIIPKQLLHFMLIVSPCLKRNYNERPTASDILVQLDRIALELNLSKKPHATSTNAPASFKR